MPLLAILMSQGMLRLEALSPRTVRIAVILGWAVGFSVAAPYRTSSRQRESRRCRGHQSRSEIDDLVFVMNMHDRGVGIGGLNPAIVTLAGRRGWNVQFDTSEPEVLRRQIEVAHRAGVRWIVATWFTPDLDPWFTPLLPADFSRQPKLNGTPVEGMAIVDHLSTSYPVVTRGSNFAVLSLDQVGR